MKRMAYAFLAGFALLLVACGEQVGGGANGGSTPNVAGTWEGTYTVASTPETGPFCVQVTQTGNLIQGSLHLEGGYQVEVTGSLNGNRFTSTVSLPGGTLRITGTFSQESATGDYTATSYQGQNFTGRWAAQKVTRQACPY
ncbi:hypothetical protein YIM730264_23510 [Thermus hydrothermalis]